MWTIRSGSLRQAVSLRPTSSPAWTPRAWTVSSESVLTFAGSKRVFVVREGKAHSISVATGVEGPGWVELLHPEGGDLREDDILIRGGQDKLAEGTRVQLRNAAALDISRLSLPRPQGKHDDSLGSLYSPSLSSRSCLSPRRSCWGLVGRSKLGVDLLPNVELPIVVVTTTLKGASVEEMETSVTKPIEQIINTVSGIDELKSTTNEGISQVVVQFFLEKDRDVAVQEVRDKVSTIVSQLPVGTDPPIIDKVDLNAMPVMQIAVAGTRPMQEITEIARKRIKEDLESVSGVGAVILVGGRQRAVNICINTDKLTSCNLSIDDVRQSLMRQNLELPGGRVDQGSRELILRTMGRITSSAGFLDLIVANQEGYPVRIRDIGRVEDTFEEPRSLARLDGRNAVSLIIQKQSGTNTVAVVENVRKRFEKLRELLPPDIETFVVKDQSRFIVQSIEEMNFHLVVAAILVAITILVFIQDWRTTIIASLAIPASIVTTFAFMYWMGYTLNNMTMLGLILAIGIVIDDAVVINENIFRHMEEDGVTAMQAASSATREISLAVSATTLSLLVIFIPIVFMGGRIGRFFSSFGATVAFSISDQLVCLVHDDPHAVLAIPQAQGTIGATARKG